MIDKADKEKAMETEKCYEVLRSFKCCYGSTKNILSYKIGESVSWETPADLLRNMVAEGVIKLPGDDLKALDERIVVRLKKLGIKPNQDNTKNFNDTF